MLQGALLLLAAYLIGSIPFPVIVSKWVAGIDLRQHGSGNMGAANAARVLGRRWFPVVFGLDFVKGAAAAWMAMRFLPDLFGVTPEMSAALGGLFAVAGHCFPVFAGFRGGVGLASSAGALLLLSPAVLAAAGVVILIAWVLAKNMYVGVAVAALAYPLIGWAVIRDPDVAAVMAVWGILVFGLHWPDLRAWWAARRE